MNLCLIIHDNRDFAAIVPMKAHRFTQRIFSDYLSYSATLRETIFTSPNSKDASQQTKPKKRFYGSKVSGAGFHLRLTYLRVS